VAEGTPEGLKSELRGDSVQVEFAEPQTPERVLAAVDSVSLVHDVVVEGSGMRARAVSGAAAVPALLGALDAARIQAKEVRVARPSLDDVYLRHTGRSFSEADK
jgi:ABC-2 type transport system ATP-binding protein